MNRLAFVLLLLPVSCWAAAPKAVISGPPAAPAGSLVLIDTTGTASDSPPVLVCIPDDASAARVESGTSVGRSSWRMRKPGTCRFYLVASGTPPNSTQVASDTAVWVVRVTPAGPTPIPVVPGPSASDPLSVGARAYIRAIPNDFTQTAADLRSGKLRTVAEINKSIADYRRSGGQALAAEMNRRFAAGSDASGTVTDPDGVASSLEAIGAAQQEALRP